jgi:hypothetical protein
MPNWCESDLDVSGNKEDLDKFVEAAGSDECPLLDINNFIPYSPEYNEMDNLEGETVGEVRNHLLSILQKYNRTDLLPKAEKWFRNKPDEEELPHSNFMDRRHGFGFNNGGYNWCVQNWNTKWNFCDVEIVDEYNDEEDNPEDPEYGIVYTFSTAWAPPIPVIEKMSQDFPDLRFELKYYEMGMGFQGTTIWKAGEVLFEEEEDYDGDRGG